MGITKFQVFFSTKNSFRMHKFKGFFSTNAILNQIWFYFLRLKFHIKSRQGHFLLIVTFTKNVSIPGPCNPIELSMPLGVSAILGVGRPDRGLTIIDFVTRAPSSRRSKN